MIKDYTQSERKNYLIQIIGCLSANKYLFQSKQSLKEINDLKVQIIFNFQQKKFNRWLLVRLKNNWKKLTEVNILGRDEMFSMIWMFLKIIKYSYKKKIDIEIDVKK